MARKGKKVIMQGGEASNKQSSIRNKQRAGITNCVCCTAKDTSFVENTQKQQR
jgi:hypothetical protein